MWAEVSSSAPCLLHKGLLVSSIKWRCLRRVLCPVRSVMTVDCVLLEDRSLVSAVGLGSKINSWACLLVLLRPCHLVKCWLSIQCFIFLLVFCLEIPKDISGPTIFWTELRDVNENLPWAFGEGELTLSLSISLGWADLCSLRDFSSYERNLWFLLTCLIPASDWPLALCSSFSSTVM